MSTLEKLFMHVFDRKQWISGQLRQQVDSYEESLACNLATSGRELPSWLFDDGTESRSDAPVPDYSNRTELNRKQIITDLLYPPSRETPIPSYKPTQSFLDSHITGICFSDNHIQNLQINEEIPSTNPEKCNKEQSQIQPDMTNIGALSTIQRSRSRQKDIEKRSSVKRAPVDTTSSFRQTDNNKAEILDKELIETSNHCRMEDGKERKQGETESSACQIMNPDLTETLGCIEAAVVRPKGLTSDVALTVSRDNLDSVTEKHSEIMNQRSQFHSEKDLSSPVGESCRIRDNEKRKEVEALKSSTSHLIIPVLTETLNPVETSAFEPKRLAFSLAFDSNLHSVVENHDETRDGSPGSVLEGKSWYPNGEYSGMRDGEERIESAETLVKVLSPEITAQELTCTPNSMVKDAVKLKRPSFDEPKDRPSVVLDSLSPKRLGQSGPRETDAGLHAHNSLLPDRVRGDEERNDEITALVDGSAPDILNTELNESPHYMDNDEVQDTHSPPIDGSQQMIKPSVGKSSDVRVVEEAFYARDSYSPMGDVTGGNNESTEANEPMVSRIDISDSLLLSQTMEVVGEEVRDLSDNNKHSLTSSFHEASNQSSLSGGTFGYCRSRLTTPDNIVGHLAENPKSVDTNLKSFSISPKSQGEGSSVKSGEGIKHLSSGGRYFLQSLARQEESNASALHDGIVALGSHKSSGKVQYHVNVNSWPKKRKMEVSSNFAFATSPRPRKRLALPEVSYCLMEEDEPETSVLVLEEYNRFPSMSSSSADNGKASISPTEPNIGSPTYDANHFSISPKEGDMSNTLKYVPEIDALIPQEDDLANSSNYVHGIDVYTSSKYDGGSFIEQEDSRPELEAFTIGTSSDSEGETRNIPDTIPLQMERASLAEQLSSSLCNLATPGTFFLAKYELNPFPNVYKSLPTGHFDFMKTGEALSVPVNDRKQLSASVTSIPYQSGPFGYPGFTMGLSTSGKSGKGRPASTTPGDKVGYRRGIPPLTPPAQKYSYGKLSEVNESENGSGKGSGIRSSGKTPLYPDSTCFTIDEDAAEDDVPNDTDTLDPRDLSAELEGSACFRIDEDAAEDDVPNDTDTLDPRDLSAVLVGSTCFRIDEDSAEDDVPPDTDTLDPRDLSAILEESTLPSVNDSQNLLEDDDPNYQNTLRDITVVFENTEIGAAIPEDFSEGGGFTGKKAKQSVASLNKRELGRKASGSMQSGLATAEAIREGREKSMGTVSSKSSNIVTSFVPLVKQKQQPVAKKREVRIPALEAAEANKRLEEKKRNERELHKAAMKAEREKLNQEKVLKKKLVEEQKKKEAGMAVKKRQREERDKKEKDKDKEKKRRCTEIDRQTQREEQTKKEPPKRARIVREEKEVQCNVIDEKEQSKREECGKEDAFVRPRETGSSIIIIDDIVEVPELPRAVEKSYEMSPYKDSDAEGDDGLDELEEDQIRRKKYIPSWARKEFLEDYLHSRKYMNPEMIFSCKCSFDMSKVLKPRNQKQRF
ncbi:hypothetical protein FCM35_KLT05073 [Carex littledalei]|uniref:Inner centromere protein ARK-binding domain-containing protein n=1 Tax=Carex littledalei TaxID=544730 RepID=A0A833V9E7_9POAL|nr:hypothetical protein FCM35_KLT05073 [Carex littledalei]